MPTSPCPRRSPKRSAITPKASNPTNRCSVAGGAVPRLRVDLAAAGIPYKTPDGNADFHALRHTFCTDLFAAGVDAKTAHVLMRHKSIEMTMSYAKTDESRKA